MGAPVANMSSPLTAERMVFQSQTDAVGQVALDAYVKTIDQNGRKEEFLLVTHKSLMKYLATNMGPGKLFQSCTLEASPSSTESKPVWVCTIVSDTLGKYSDVGEASVRSTDMIEKAFAATIAQNRAKDRAVLFFLNLSAPEGKILLSETELNRVEKEKAVEAGVTSGESYSRGRAHTAYPTQMPVQGSHQQMEMVLPAQTPATAPVTQPVQVSPVKTPRPTQRTVTPQMSAPIRSIAQKPKEAAPPVKKENVPVRVPENKPEGPKPSVPAESNEARLGKILKQPPNADELERWKSSCVMLPDGTEKTMLQLTRSIEFGLPYADFAKAYMQSKANEGDKTLLHYLAKKHMLRWTGTEYTIISE